MTGRLRGWVLLAWLVGAAGCAPWLSPATRPGLAPGDWEVGLGLAWLAPPSARVWDGLPAPQLWASRGVASGAEVRAAYSPPLTLDGRVRLEVVDRSGTTVDLHAGGGWLSFGGAFDIPLGGLPFLAGGAALVRRPEPGGRAGFATLSLTAPFRRHQGDRTAWAAWASAVVGMETERGRWRLAPQVGAIVPLARPGDWIWFPGLSVYRSP